MNHLSGLDAMFLHVESPEMPMHVGSLNVLDLPEGYAGDFFEDAKAHISSRMHLADLFTRKLALMPFDLSNPVWVDDEDIDIDHHIRHITLPKPGSNRQLQQYVARLHSSLLDRSRPLWELFVIDGLKSGQVAVYVKAHHAGMDGQAGVAVAQAIFDLGPEGRVVKAPRPKQRRNQYQLGIAELASAAARNTIEQLVKLVKTAPAMVRAVRDVAIPAKDEHGKRDWSLPKSVKLFGPRTMFNVAITNQRSFAGRTIPLAETKFIGKTLGGTLNDVVMCTTAGALRRYLREYNDLPAKSLIAAVPVSLRAAGDSSANNQVSMVTNTLATDIKDPVARLHAIHTAANANKAMMGRVNTAIPADFPMLGAPWLDRKSTRQNRHPHRLPHVGCALAGVGPGLAVWPLAPGQCDAAAGQCAHLQRAGQPRAVVPGRGQGHQLLPRVHSGAQHGAERDRAKLRRPPGLRPDCLPPRCARHQ